MNSHTTEDTSSNLIEMILVQIKLLPKGSIVRVKHLVEPVFWLISSKSIHLELGHLVADLVRQNRLPLAYADKASNNHQQYIVI